MSTSTYIFILILILLIASGLFIVKQQTFAVIERFGRFIALRKPGLHIKIPLIDKIANATTFLFFLPSSVRPSPNPDLVSFNSV